MCDETVNKFIARNSFHDQSGRYFELGPSLVAVVHAFRLSLLRHRAHANRRPTGRFGAVRRGAASYAPAIRSYDRCWHTYVQNGQADQTTLRSDARPKVRNLDGTLFQLRRAVPVGLFGLPGGARKLSR